MHALPGAHEQLVVVTVPRDVAVAMVDLDLLAIPRIPAGQDDGTGCGGVHRCAVVVDDIDAGVELAIRVAPIAETTRDASLGRPDGRHRGERALPGHRLFAA